MGSEMTSRERVYATLNHEEPDRVPIDFGGNYNTCVSAIAYNRLKKHLGIDTPTYGRSVITMIASPDLDEGLEIMKMMGGDILEFPSNMWGDWKDGLPYGVLDETMEFTLKDGSKCIFPSRPEPLLRASGDWEIEQNGITTFRMPGGGYYFDRIHNPMAEIKTIKQLEELFPFMIQSGYYAPLKEKYLDKMSKHAKQAHEQTDFFIIGNIHSYLSVWHACLEAFGYENYYMFMAADPEFVHCWMEFSTNALINRLDGYLKAVGPYINGFIIGDDYGTQNAPQMSTKMFRELVKPYLTRICKFIHETCPHVKILQHSCGSIAPLIPELIDAGVDAVNPVQTTAKNMDAEMLKREFGKDITFWGGGVSCQTTLFDGTVKDVEDEVKKKLEIFKPGGGYVFTTDHDIQEHVMPEMILAAFQTAQKYRNY